MKRLLIVLALILLLATVVTAQSYYQELEIRLDGDYKLNTSLTLPEVVSVIDLEGIGAAYIKSKLIVITEDASQLTKWWDLF